MPPMTSEASISAPSMPGRRLAIVAIMLIVLCSGTAFGLSLPLVSLLLERRGYDPALAGLMAACGSIATLAVGPFVERIARRLGSPLAIAGGLGVCVVSFVVFPLVEPLPALFALRFLYGCGFTIGWVLSETLLNQLAREAERGRLIGWYATCFMAGMALGPALVAVMGSQGLLPFVVGAAIIGAGAVVVLVAGGTLRRIAPAGPSTGMTGLRHFALIAPAGFLAALLSGASEGSYFTLLPLYGLGIGLTESAAVALTTVFAIGAIVFQVPIGWIADRIDRVKLLGMIVLGCLASTLLLPAGSPQAPLLLWPVAVVAGGAVAGLYTVGLVIIGERFSGRSIAPANALFIMSYTAGTIAGPPASGATMTLWPPHGFVACLVAVYGAALIAIVLRRGRR